MPAPQEMDVDGGGFVSREEFEDHMDDQRVAALSRSQCFFVCEHQLSC